MWVDSWGLGSDPSRSVLFSLTVRSVQCVCRKRDQAGRRRGWIPRVPIKDKHGRGILYFKRLKIRERNSRRKEFVQWQIFFFFNVGSGSLIKKKKKVSFKNSYDKYANCYVCSVTCRMRLESLQFLYAICFVSRKMITARAFLESLEEHCFFSHHVD